jgi:ribosome-associated protein
LRENTIKEISNDNSTVLADYIVELIQDKKGKSIINLDLRAIPEAPTDCFIICHGDSSTQVKAIVNHIYQEMKEKWGEIPHHIEGMGRAEWAIIDYTNVVVHVFYKETRAYYQLEDLWYDAKVTTYEEKY